MNDLAWRKFPVNTIRNEDLDYIAFLLPEELKAAPFMFYMTAICKCDDDGVFDIEDGVIFARLMRMGTAAQILQIAQYMSQRRIITQVISGSSIYMITDWDAPDRRNAIKSKTAEERRAIIAQKIEAEQRARAQQQAMQQRAPEIKYENPVEVWPTAPAPAPAPVSYAEPLPVVDWNELQAARKNLRTAELYPTPKPDRQDGAVAAASAAAFFCPLNDKNAQNVEKTERERDREIPRETEENTESKKETHTEETEDMREEASRASGPFMGPPAPLAEETGPEKAEESEKDGIPAEENPSAISGLAEEAIGPINENREAGLLPEEVQELTDIANDFFVRNSLIFSQIDDAHSIAVLVERVGRLRTPKNPAPTVMKTILRQFKIRATTKGDYFYNCKITPQFLLTDNTWQHILQQASALLLTYKENDSEWKFQMHTKKPEDIRAISNEMKSECIKYGIDPDDPNRASKLLIAKNTPASGNTSNTG